MNRILLEQSECSRERSVHTVSFGTQPARQAANKRQVSIGAPGGTHVPLPEHVPGFAGVKSVSPTAHDSLVSPSPWNYSSARHRGWRPVGA